MMNTFREAIGKRSLQGISILTLLCVITFSTYANPLAKRLAEKAAVLAAKEALKALLDQEIPLLEDQLERARLDHDAKRSELNKLAPVFMEQSALLMEKESQLSFAYSDHLIAIWIRISDEGIVEMAKSSLKSANSAYDSALRAYLDHTGSCYYCVGSSMCYDGTMYNNDRNSAYTALQNAKQALKNAEDALSESKSAEKNAEAAVVAIEAETTHIRIGVNLLNHQILGLESEIGTLEAEVTRLQQEVDAKNAERARLDMEIPELKKEIADIREQLGLKTTQ